MPNDELKHAELIAYIKHSSAVQAAVYAHEKGLDLWPYFDAIETTRAAWDEACRARVLAGV